MHDLWGVVNQEVAWTTQFKIGDSIVVCLAHIRTICQESKFKRHQSVLENICQFFDTRQKPTDLVNKLTQTRFPAYLS
jgi:hypothetical protein